MADYSQTSPAPLKLYKASAYAVIAVSSITAFGHISRVQGSSGLDAAAIAFAVIAALLSLALLALWLVNEAVADKACLPAAHVTLLALAVALGTAAHTPFFLIPFALYTALVLALLLCVHHWTVLEINVSIASNNNNNSANDNATSHLSSQVVSPNVVGPPA